MRRRHSARGEEFGREPEFTTPDGRRVSVTQVEEEVYQATVASPLEPGEYAIVEKIIVSVVGSPDRKAAGPFVLGLGLDGKPEGKSSR